MDPTLDYFEEYRRKLNQLAEIEVERIALHKQMIELKDRRLSLDTELSNMRKIITSMITTGADPVEAKLKIDMNDGTPTLWNEQQDYYLDSDVIMQKNHRYTIELLNDGSTNLTTSGIQFL